MIGLVILANRYKSMDNSFLPFFLLLLSATINEAITPFTGRYFHNTNVNNNIAVLFEGVLILWQFYRWDLFDNNKKLYHFLMALVIGVWCWEMFIYSKITYIASYYRILYSFIVALASIHMINYLIVTENRSLLKSPVFLICCAFILYFTIKVLVEAFWLYGLNLNKDFRINVYNIHFIANLLSNLIFALAALWVPRKQVFITPF